MSKLKKAIAVSAMLILLCSNVFAETNTLTYAKAENGKIIFNFDLPEGRNNGINNVVKFRTISDVSGEEIIYEIQ